MNLVLALAAVSAAAAQSSSGSHCIGSQYCVYANTTAATTIYTVHAAATGWAALGFGGSMDDSKMIIGWKSGNTYVVTSRDSKASVMPTTPSTPAAVLAPLAIPAKPWARLAFSFSLPSLKPEDATDAFIWASSNTAVTTPNSPTSKFSIHDHKGVIAQDFTTSDPEPATPKPAPNAQPADTKKDLLSGKFCQQDVFCVLSVARESSIVFTVLSAANSWAAFGIGSSMTKTFMTMGWKNNTGGYTVSSRYSSGHVAPVLAPGAIDPSVASDMAVPSWANLAYSFQMPRTSSLSSNATYIWAHSSAEITGDIDSPSASFRIHDEFGTISNVDFTAAPSIEPSEVLNVGLKPIIGLPSHVSFDTVIKIHAWFMIYAWILCPFLGVFVARFLKARLPNIWFRLHVFIMTLGVGFFSITGILLIFLYKYNRWDFSEPHQVNSRLNQIAGIVITVVFLVQIGIGIASDKYYNPYRVSAPVLDKVHWWLGRILIIAALANTVFGILLFQEKTGGAIDMSLCIGAGISLVFGVLLMAYGQMYLSGSHSQLPKLE